MSSSDDIQMAYLSFATRGLKVDSDEEIQKILVEARAHNAKVGITGQLVYRGGIFLQLLEGNKEHVSSLLGKILLDNKRHENIRILFKQPMLKRVFPDWSMAYKRLDNDALDLVDSIVPWQQLIHLSEQNKAVTDVDILRVFQKLAA